MAGRKLALLSIPVMVVAITLGGIIAAQEGGDDATATKKEGAKPRGRLPNYFTSVVDGVQREKIYAIQSDYAKQLEDLQRQLNELKAKCDQEVDAVLTPEQLEIVNARRAEASVKRKARLEALKKEKEAAAPDSSE